MPVSAARPPQRGRAAVGNWPGRVACQLPPRIHETSGAASRSRGWEPGQQGSELGALELQIGADWKLGFPFPRK